METSKIDRVEPPFLAEARKSARKRERKPCSVSDLEKKEKKSFNALVITGEFAMILPSRRR